MWEIILNWVELHPRSTGLGIAFAALVIAVVWHDTRPNRCGYCGSADTRKSGQGKPLFDPPTNLRPRIHKYPPGKIFHYYTCNHCGARFHGDEDSRGEYKRHWVP